MSTLAFTLPLHPRRRTEKLNKNNNNDLFALSQFLFKGRRRHRRYKQNEEKCPNNYSQHFIQ